MEIRASEYSNLDRIGLKEAILESKAYTQEHPQRLIFTLIEDGLKPSFPCFKGKKKRVFNGPDEELSYSFKTNTRLD